MRHRCSARLVVTLAADRRRSGGFNHRLSFRDTVLAEAARRNMGIIGMKSTAQGVLLKNGTVILTFRWRLKGIAGPDGAVDIAFLVRKIEEHHDLADIGLDARQAFERLGHIAAEF